MNFTVTDWSVETDEQLDSWDPDEPMKAHHVFSSDPYTAFCGARLLGIPAQPGHPVCEECADILRAINGGRNP